MGKHRRMTIFLVIGSILFLSAGLAMAGGNLVIYNAGSPELGNDLVRAFKIKYPDIKTDVIRQGSGELITRIKGEAGKPQGDVILAVAKENLEVIRDLLQSYKVREDAAFPDDVKDSQEYKFYGFSFNIQAFIINTELVPLSDAPKTWAELGDNKWRGQVVLANPALSGSAYAQLYQMVDLYGWDFINKVRKVTTCAEINPGLYLCRPGGSLPSVSPERATFLVRSTKVIRWPPYILLMGQGFDLMHQGLSKVDRILIMPKYLWIG